MPKCSILDQTKRNHCGKVTKIQRETKREITVILTRFVHISPHLHSSSLLIRIILLGTGREFLHGNFFQLMLFFFFPRVSFLYLLFFKCFQLKIILKPKWHVLGQHILPPFTILIQFQHQDYASHQDELRNILSFYEI